MIIDEEYIPPPEALKEVINPPKAKTKKRERKFHMKLAPIEQVTEFDIVQYIKDLPYELSIGQASAQIPKYKNAMLQSIRRKREINYTFLFDENPQTTNVRYIIKVDR